MFVIVCQRKNIGVYVSCFELEPCKHDNGQQEFAHFYCTVANTMFSYSTSSVIASPTHHNSCFKLQLELLKVNYNACQTTLFTLEEKKSISCLVTMVINCPPKIHTCYSIRQCVKNGLKSEVFVSKTHFFSSNCS